MQNAKVDVTDLGFSDHRLLQWISTLDRPSPVYRTTTGRPWRSINNDNFTNLLCQSAMSTINHLNSLNRLLMFIRCVIYCYWSTKLQTLRTLSHHLVLQLNVCDAPPPDPLTPCLMKSVVWQNENVDNWNVELVVLQLVTSLSRPGASKSGIIAY